MSPTYKEILEQVGSQLKKRKNALLKRTLLITWPYIVFMLAVYFFDKYYNIETLPEDQMVTWVLIGISMFLLCLIYTVIVSFIFNIEKRIWIDSYFDHKNLTLSESWRIAKKLFWPAVSFRFKILLYYYLIPFFVLIACTILIAYNFYGFDESFALIAFITVPVTVIMALIYSYYIKTKLRYTWFLFLDNYNHNHSYSFLITEMKKLNNISKTDTFKKSLVTSLGTDSVNALTQIAVGTIYTGISMFGGEAGKLLGGITEIYGKELARQATDFGNISAQYILYRFARKELYGEEQTVNDSIYLL